MGRTPRNRVPGTVAFWTRAMPVRVREGIDKLATSRHWTVTHAHAVVCEAGLKALGVGVEKGKS